jgi:hypothetical protein
MKIRIPNMDPEPEENKVQIRYTAGMVPVLFLQQSASLPFLAMHSIFIICMSISCALCLGFSLFLPA